MRTKEFKGVRLSVEDHQSLLSIQREMQRWGQSEIAFAAVSDSSGFYMGQLLFVARDSRVGTGPPFYAEVIVLKLGSESKGAKSESDSA